MSGYSVGLNDPNIFRGAFSKPASPIKDPCDYVMRYGGEAFKVLVAQAKHVVDFKFDLLVAQSLELDPNAHAGAIESAVAWFAQYIHMRTGLEPDHPACITPYKRGAIFLRLSQVSGLTVDEVKRIIDWNICKMSPHKLPPLKLGGFAYASNEKREAALQQLEEIEHTETQYASENDME